MKLENQVCSLDLAKRLKELGVKQESLFRWTQLSGRFPIFVKESKEFPAAWDDGVSAFTVAELGEMLPFLYYSEKWGGNNQWVCNMAMGARTEKRDYPNMQADIEADARARMVVYLIENGILNPNESKMATESNSHGGERGLGES